MLYYKYKKICAFSSKTQLTQNTQKKNSNKKNTWDEQHMVDPWPMIMNEDVQ